MTIKQKLERIQEDPFLCKIAQELQRIHEEHGNTELPDSPPMRLVEDMPPLFSSSNVGEWGGREEDVSKLFNTAIVNLYSALGYTHCGNGIWLIPSDCDEQWRRYQEESLFSIEDWIAYEAQEHFIDVARKILERGDNHDA